MDPQFRRTHAPHIVERTNSGGFQSADGMLYVSKPYRSSSTRKLRATITFAPRASHFDTNNVSSGTNEFRVRCLPSQVINVHLTNVVVDVMRNSVQHIGLLHVVLDLDIPVHDANIH